MRILYVFSVIHFLFSLEVFGQSPVRINIVHNDSELPLDSNGKRIKAVGNILDAKIHPELENVMKKTGDLVKKLLIPEDKATEVSIILVDDMSPNASYNKIEDGRITIHVNVGLFKEVENDDELAFILGHELEHGHSELTEKHNIYSNRTGEAEIDLKSIYRRVHPNGYNPHSQQHFFRRMQKKYGDGGGETHVVNSSRADAGALGIAKMEREYGIKILEDTPSHYQKTIITDVQKSYFESEDYIKLAKARWEKELFDSYDTISWAFENRILKEYDNNKISGLKWAIGEENFNEISKKFYGEKVNDVVFYQGLRERKLELELENYIRNSKKFNPQNNFNDVHAIKRISKAFSEVDGDLGYLEFEKFVKLINDRNYYLNQKSSNQTKMKLSKIEASINALKSQYQNFNEVEKIALEFKEIQKIEPKNLNKIEELKRRYYKQLNPKAAAFIDTKRMLKEQVVKKANEMFLKLTKDISQWDELFILYNSDIHFDRPANDVLLNDLLHMIEEVNLKDSKEANRLFKSEMFMSVLNKVRDKEVDVIRRIVKIKINDPDVTIESFHLSAPARPGIRIDGHLELDHKMTAQVIGDNKELAQKIHEKIIHSKIQEINAGKFTRDSLKKLVYFYETYLDSPIVEIVAKNKMLNRSQMVEEIKEIMEKTYALKLRKELAGSGIEGITVQNMKKIMAIIDPNLFRYHFRDFNELSETYELYFKILKANNVMDSNYFASLEYWFNHYGKFLSRDQAYLQLRSNVSFLNMSRIEKANITQPFKDFLVEFGQQIFKADDIRLDEFLALITQLKKINENFFTYSDISRPIKLYPAQVIERLHYLIEKENPTVGFLKVMRKLTKYCEMISVSIYDIDAGLYIPKDAQKQFEFVHDLLKKNEVIELRFIKGIPYIEFKDNFRITFQSNFHLMDVFNDQILAEKIGIDKLTDVFIFLAQHNTMPSAEFDDIYEKWWSMTEQYPTLRSKFELKYVNSLYYDASKKKMAKFQIEDRLKLKKVADDLKKTPLDKRHKSGVRDIVQKAHDILLEQFPTPGVVRGELVDEVEKLLVTNKEETAILHALRTTDKNWTESTNAIKFFDLPHLTVSTMGPKSRLSIVEYLIGIAQKNPMSELIKDQSFNPEMVKSTEEKLDRVRSNFLDGTVDGRTYVLMPFMDTEKGILSDPLTFDKLVDELLGKRKDKPVIKALVHAYLDSLSNAQRAVIMSKISAMRAGQGLDGTVSLGKILELMGPLGIKAGQFFVSSGIGGAEMAEELRDLLNKAAPPNRHEIFGRIEQLLGNQVKVVDYVGDMVGSGSVNYVVRGIIITPGTGIKKEVVIRVLRDAVEGNVANEEKIWQKTADLLEQSKNADQIKVSKMIREAKSVAMRTLDVGGQELNLALEANWYPHLKEAYEGTRGLAGFKVEVIRPLTEITDKFDAKAKEAVAFYEYIDGIPLWKVEDPMLRGLLAHHILNTELKAMIHHGYFDPDTQLGNWIVDLKNKKIVRIDYSQALHLKGDQRSKIQKAIKFLFMPEWDHEAKKSMADLVTSLMDFEKPINNNELLKQIDIIVQDPGFPSYKNPQDRMLFLRERLEVLTQMNVRLKTETQAVFASLGRLMALSDHMGNTLFASTIISLFDINPTAYFNEAKAVVEVKGKEIGKKIVEKAKAAKEKLSDVGNNVADSMTTIVQPICESGKVLLNNLIFDTAQKLDKLAK